MLIREARKVILVIVALLVVFYGYKYTQRLQTDNDRLLKELSLCSAELKAMIKEKERAVSLLNEAESLVELQVAKQQDCITTIKSARVEVASCEDSFHKLETTCDSLKEKYEGLVKSFQELKSAG